MIQTHDFIKEMEHHWKTLGNIVSPKLREAWGQIATAFSNHISTHDEANSRDKWTVLSPPTGSGKSQGTAVYCSMLSKLPKEAQPGVLIVTRLKTDADEMAACINNLSGRNVAVAFHTDAKDVGIQGLHAWEVLVITHKAYELALDKLGAYGQIQQTWGFFHQYREADSRQLVVIDESLDIVEESQGNLEGLRHTLGCIPQALREKHSYPIKGIEALITVLESMALASEGNSTKEAVLLSEMVKEGTPPDYTELRKDLRNVRFDLQNHKNDLVENNRLHKVHDLRLKQLDTIFRSWSYYAKLGDLGHTLNTARLLVPENSKGAVVLDATAIHDVIYELFDRVEIIEPPEGVRNYSNVNLWVSWGHKQGKVFLRNNASKLSSALLSELSQVIPKDRKVFLCCHKDVEPVLLTYSPSFNMKVGHWGAVDGSNQWQDCDTAVIFGLPYMPDTWSANAFFALRGVQDTEWLQTPHRPFGRHIDVREALKTGHVVASVVQAINRIRCRKVTDSEGNCPKADVYLMLPDGKSGQAILRGILRSMPGINLQEWAFSEAKKKPRKNDSEEALVRFAEGMIRGKYACSVIKKSLGISSTTWERLAAKLKDSASEIHTRLTSCGVRYFLEGSGQRQRAYLVKT